MNKDFQLTYTISPVSEDDKSSANTARKYIAEMPSTTKIDDIETTLVGKLPLSATTIKEKRKEAQNIIKKRIEKILDEENDVLSSVRVYLSLMVDGLGEHIEFNM